jgi:hypothetical protein
MSIWTHFTGSFGIDGIIFGDARWNAIENEISQLISPLPGDKGSADPAVYKIKLHDSESLHFADVLVSGDLRYVDSLYGIEDWLRMIMRRLQEKGWTIRCGCFYAYVEGQAPAIYYCDVYDDNEEMLYSWRKIENVNGVLLHE